MGQQGFTLVEQIVTIAIMAMVLVAGVAALSTGALGLTVTVSRNQAMNLAQQQLECIKGADYQDSASYSGATDSCPEIGYNDYTTTTIAQGVLPDTTEPPSNWDTCSGPSCDAQLIQVSVSRGGNSILDIEDLKVDRPVEQP